MIVKQGDITKYLRDYKEGRIALGDGIGCDLDEAMRYKQGSFNLILGRNGVGKTYFKTWHQLALSMKFREEKTMKWCIWTGENKAGQVVRNLIQWYTGTHFKQLSMSEICRAEQEISQWFYFVDNSKMYKYKELLDVFESDDYSGCLIDPYTGLDREYSFGSNYDFLNETRQWVNQKNITVDVCTHPISSSGRAGAVYPKGHDWEGYIRNPYQSDVEGGDAFSNRMDDFICLHRMKDHPTMKTYTQVYVYKIKDHDTGGMETEFEQPVLCEFNKGLGFKVNGINPLIEDNFVPLINHEPKPLPKNLAFEDTVQVSKQKLEADKEQQRRDAIDKEIEDNGIEFTPTKQTI